jgi:hypothetical protein
MTARTMIFRSLINATMESSSGTATLSLRQCSSLKKRVSSESIGSRPVWMDQLLSAMKQVNQVRSSFLSDSWTDKPGSFDAIPAVFSPISTAILTVL